MTSVCMARELVAMSFGRNYRGWILQIFKSFLGTRLVEVGAGTGAFSEMLLMERPKSLTLLEPSTRMFSQLTERIGQRERGTEIKTYNARLSEVKQEITRPHRPDSIIYLNFLEHILDDAKELAHAHRTLCRRGRLFVFVPALGWLFGRLDTEVGHFRRYHRADLRTKCQRAGFAPLKCIYFDFAGIAPWWISYCLLKSSKMQPQMVKLYDEVVVPVSRAIESIVRPPIGKYLVLIAEKR